MLSVLRNPAIMVLSLGHLALDILNSSLPVLLVAFAVRLDLSNAELGTIATAYALVASLTQPLFGYLADRWNSRWVGVGGLLWLAGGFFVASLLPGTLSLVALVVAAFGSGAFHPQGTLNTRLAAGEHAASGTSIFFFFGQIGLALGPILAGLLLARLALPMTIAVLVAVVAPVALLLARFAPSSAHLSSLSAASHSTEEKHAIRWVPLSLAAFLAVLFFRGWPTAATRTFLPKWLADSGFASPEFGTLLGLFMFASAIGNIFGGWLGDSWSRKGMVVLSLVLSPFPLFVLYMTPSVGVVATLATIAAGFTMGMSGSVVILMGQNLFPGRMGLGSGLIMGFIFSVEAITAWITGWLGDRIGLEQSLQWLPWIAALAAVCAFALPRTRPQPAPASLSMSGD